jgi:SAM-dependent methyltransferase
MFSLGYEAWDLTAIDMSRASLAFAQRQMQKFKVPDIHFLVCDILDVRRLEKQFDLIECVGVLHHMADPVKGWHALVDVLRPGGIMSISLYSALARRFVIEAQAYAAERGYEPTAKDIRRFRHELIEAMRNPAATINDRNAARLGVALKGLFDFYSTSMCRDLIFHVQERNFTLREIANAISTLGLRFLGFRFTSYTISKDYRARFPDDPSCTKLSNWITYEEENPDTFIDMYNFDVQKLLN